jgi:hypothetical protein
VGFGKFQQVGQQITPIPAMQEQLSMDFLKDLWGFLKQRKKFWLLPIIVIMLMFGALMVFAGGSAIAPFIYTLF